MQVFTSMLVLGIVFWTFIVTEISAYRKRKTESVTSLAQVIATNAISVLQFQDNETAATMLGELTSVSPDIAAATILDKQGKVFAQRFRQPIDTTKEQLIIAYPITNNSEPLGKIVLSARLTDLVAIKRSLLSMSLILAAIAIVASFLIARIVQSSLSLRLE